MNVNLWAAAVIGTGGIISGLGILYQIYNGLRDQKVDRDKKVTGVALDDTTRTRIAAEAAQINSDERIATERWWKEQFDAVKAELVLEQEWRRKVTNRLRLHKPWDDHMYDEAKRADWHVSPPPSLDPDADDKTP